MNCSRWPATLALPILVAGFYLPSLGADLEYRSQAFWCPAESETLIVADINADGLRELTKVLDDLIRSYFQGEDGFDVDAVF